MMGEAKEWQIKGITPKNGNWNQVNGELFVPGNKANYPNLAI
jgi:hypothetical protein